MAKFLSIITMNKKKSVSPLKFHNEKKQRRDSNTLVWLWVRRKSSWGWKDACFYRHEIVAWIQAKIRGSFLLRRQGVVRIIFVLTTQIAKQQFEILLVSFCTSMQQVQRSTFAAKRISSCRRRGVGTPLRSERYFERKISYQSIYRRFRTGRCDSRCLGELLVRVCDEFDIHEGIAS